MIDLRSFTHKQTKNALNGVKCYETLDLNEMQWLIKSNLLKTSKWTSEWGFNIELENERQQIETMYKMAVSQKSKNKILPVSYFQSYGKDIGRVYPHKSLSLCAVRREIRHTLAGQHYYDIDMENAHPVILQQIAFNEGVECKYLTAYVQHREELLADIMDTYQVSRDQAKKLIIRICYGGEFSSWCQDCNVIPQGVLEFVEGLTGELTNIGKIIWERNSHLQAIAKKSNNPQRTLMSYFAQDIECRLLSIMFEYLVKEKVIPKHRNGSYGCVLCFDGIMVPKENVNVPIQVLLQNIKTHIFSKTNFNINFTDKPMEDGLHFEKLYNEAEQKGEDALAEFKKEHNVVGDSDVITIAGNEFNYKWTIAGVDTDQQAGEKVLTLYPYWKYNSKSKSLYVFDEDTGLWSDNKMVHKKIIGSLSPYLHVLKDDGEKGKKSYGNTKLLMDKVFDFISCNCIDDAWFRKTENSSLGYLLFSNGYIEMKTMKFYSKEKDGFNPDIVFYGRINRPFKKVKARDIETLRQKLFYNALGKEQGDYFITFLARGLAGDISMKKMLFGVGVGNSGKGTITKLALLALDDYATTWNAGNIAYSNNSNDEAQKLRWLMNICRSRLAFSNEISSNVELDGNKIKKLASGGDALVGRGHGQDEIEFTPHITPIGLVNDLPKIVPYDDAVDNRIRITSFQKSYVDNPTNQFEMEKDDEFVKSIYDTYTQDCFVAMLLFAYDEFDQAGRVMVEPPCVMSAKEEWVGKSKGYLDTFADDFEITNNPDHFVSNTELESWLKDQRAGITIRKFNIEIKRMAQLKNFDKVESGRGKVGVKRVRGLIGVKHRYCECEIET